MILSAHDFIWRWTAGMKFSDENHFIEITQEKFQNTNSCINDINELSDFI